MIVGRIIGLLLLAGAFTAVGAEIMRSVEAGAWDPLAFGYFWYSLSPGGINLTQAIVERYLHPFLWDPVAIEILQWPTWLVAGVPGLALALAFRRREPRRWFRR